MSSPEPAQKQIRQDGARQAAIAPRSPEVATAAGASAATLEANGQAGDAATSRMVADEGNHDGKWMTAWHDVADATQIVAEIVKLGLFNPFTGSFSGNLEIGKAIYYSQIFAPGSALASAVTLHGANRGSNPVHVNLNLYHKTFELTASTLSIAGFHSGTATGKTADLHGLRVTATKGGPVALEIASAIVHDVTFVRGADHLQASEIELTGLAASGTANSDLVAALHFREGHVSNIIFGNAAPVSFALPSGGTVDAVWQHTPAAAPGATTAPTTTTAGPAHAAGAAAAAGPAAAAAAPSLDVLPPGAKVDVKIGNPRAHAAIAGQTTATTDIDFLTVTLNGATGAQLAQIAITGFHGKGNASTSAADVSLDQLKLTGAPGLINALLSNPALGTDPHVVSAMALVRSLGIKPSISGSVVFSHVGLQHGAAGDEATGDFVSDLTLPGVGKLGVKVTKLSVGTTDGARGSFEHFEATLLNESGKELGHVDLDGGAAKNADAATRTAVVHKFHARGDVAGIVRAADALIQQMPITVRSGFAMVRALGIQGDVTGSLTATGTKAGGTEIAGNFSAHIAAGAIGAIAVEVADFRGSAETSTDATFRNFKTTLTNPRGHVVADIHIANGNFVEGQKGTSTFKAGAVTAKGDSSSVMAMVNSVMQHSDALSPPVRAAFNLVRAYYVNGGGSLALSGVSVADSGTGAEAIHLQSAVASFKLGTGEAVDVSITGFSGTTGGTKGTGVDFDKFSATLAAPVGGGHAKIVIEKGGAKLAAPSKKTGAVEDFSVTSHHASFDGEVTSISKLTDGLRAHLGSLPAPIAGAFDIVGRYASSQVGNSVTASVSGDNLAVAEAHGRETSTGDVTARVAIAAGTANVAVHGFVGTGKDVKFSGLDLSVVDPGGATAASLRVGATHLEASGALTVASVVATGDGARLREVVDVLGSRVPAAVSQALSTVGNTRIDAAISSISVAPTTDGGLVTDAAIVRVTGAVSVKAGADTYRSPNASFAIYGAHVTLGADKKPREIDATSMDVSGTFTSVSGGRAIDGNATLHVGASRIALDASGKVHSVDTGSVSLAGEVTSTTGATPAPAPTAAARTQAPAATAAPTGAARTTAPAGTASTAPDQPLAVTAAQEIKSADINATTPIEAGRWGSGMKHIVVPEGATIYTSLQIRDYAMTNGTKVQIRPKLETYFIKVDGVSLETSGTQGALELNLTHFFDINLTKYVVGSKHLNLDFGAAVAQIMATMGKSVAPEAAGSNAPAPTTADAGSRSSGSSPSGATGASGARSARGSGGRTAATPAKESDLQRRHDKWESGRNAKAKDEPRSDDIMDLFKTGIQVAQTAVTADVEVASRDGHVDAHLHGTGRGTGGTAGIVQLAATDLHAQTAAGTVDATNVDTGAIQVASKGNQTNVQLSGFTIQTLHWLGS